MAIFNFYQDREVITYERVFLEIDAETLEDAINQVKKYKDANRMCQECDNVTCVGTSEDVLLECISPTGREVEIYTNEIQTENGTDLRIV